MKLLPFHSGEDLQVTAFLERRGPLVEFGFALDGRTDDLVFPCSAPAKRADGLWRSTCFEAFIATGTTSYLELNFAPSGEWAAYSFADYRSGMCDLDVPPPQIRFENNRLLATAKLPQKDGALNLTAVIEHKDGSRGYWALAHPKGERPDFHVRDCFVAKLP